MQKYIDRAHDHKKQNTYKEGYCENCGNFGRLYLSTNGQYLCEECRDERNEIDEEEAQEPDY